MKEISQQEKLEHLDDMIDAVLYRFSKEYDVSFFELRVMLFHIFNKIFAGPR